MRLLFCLFAENTAIFEKDGFRALLEEHSAPAGPGLGAMLSNFFAGPDRGPAAGGDGRRRGGADGPRPVCGRVAGCLYDPATMPPALAHAHQALDRAVDRCNRPQPFGTELARL